jgi:adenosylhomocysteine nucleosidase
VGSNRIVVLTALPLEAAAVRAHLPQPTRHDLPTGTIIEETALEGTGYNVCLVCTGPGNGQAAVVAERVINWADPVAVFFVGIAGALKDDVALGDVVAATRVVGTRAAKRPRPASRRGRRPGPARIGCFRLHSTSRLMLRG